jgi:hypothetical protein
VDKWQACSILLFYGMGQTGADKLKFAGVDKLKFAGVDKLKFVLQGFAGLCEEGQRPRD